MARTDTKTSEVNNVQDAFHAIVGEEHGTMIMLLVQMLGDVPASVFENAIQRIERAEAIGPFIDPTAFIGGTFEKASEWKTIMRALLALRKALPTPDNDNDEQVKKVIAKEQRVGGSLHRS